MGRTETRLAKIRERLAAYGSLAEAGADERAAVVAELEDAAARIPRADAALAPLLRRLAAAVEVGSGSPSVASAIDGCLDYAARRDHPHRESVLEAAAALVDASEVAAGPSAATDAPTPGAFELPAGFVGDLPPESTLDDASILLVQLEPGDTYGIHSLVDILERLAVDADRSEEDRSRLHEAARLLTGRVDESTLERVGALMEEVAEGRADIAEGAEPEAPMGAEAGMAAPSAAESGAGTAPAEGEHGPVAWTPGADVDEDLIREFMVESRDLLASAEQALLALEADPSDGEAVNVVFRAFHTIKGTSAFLGVEQASDICHHAESLLSRVREGSLEFGAPIADISLRSVDALEAVLDDVAIALDGGSPRGFAALPELVRGLQEATAGRIPAPAATAPTLDDPAADPVAAVVSGAAAQAGGSARSDADASVRVRTDRLDRLVDMVGELVIAHSMIAQDEVVQRGTQPELARKVTHSGKIVRELQDLSMALRMVPLKSTYSKLQRLVRDLARKSGKEVRLFTEGEDTEIDRTMVDTLGDPLVHMIRNAVDHGLETVAERREAGKSPQGTVQLRSFHAGGNVVVELEDDGRGMSRDRIIAKAVDRGLIRSGDGLTDSEVWKLVFEPGFSTAEKVTDVSGRGVGMDVVRRNIESMRGRIDVESTEGSGTRVTLRLPLTLAITEGMLMRVGAERYILPTLSIERTVRPTAETVSSVAGRGEMLSLRDELLPVVRLHRLFGIEEAEQRLTDGLLVVAGAADRRCALLVDELLGQQQVVVKSLGDGLGKVEGVAGGAVLGDGTVGLILDPMELINLARRGETSSAAA